MTTKLAVLAPEIPSVSATFVYREILALRRAGAEVTPFSLRPVAPEGVAADGLPFLGEVRNVYGRSPVGIAATAIAQMVRCPRRSLRALRTCMRDALGPDVHGLRARGRLVGQAVAGLSLARDLRVRGVEHLDIQFAHNVANVGMYAAMAAGIPFSVVAHANDIYVNASLLRAKLARAKTFRTISEANREALVERFGPAAENVQGSLLTVFRSRHRSLEEVFDRAHMRTSSC